MPASSTPILRFLLRHLEDLALVLGAVVIVALAWFSYRGLYATLVGAEEIVALRTNVATEDIDHDRLDRIRERLRAREAMPTIDPTRIRDVFALPQEPPPATPPRR